MRERRKSPGFLEAYGAFDVEQATTYLADDATIASLGGQDDLRLLVSYLEATGYQQILDSCEALGTSSSGTSVRCPFAFHALRSGEIGRGPFGGGSFDLVVRDGKIVQASQGWEIEKFSPQVWEPFANWVSKAHPKDAVMYLDESNSNVRLPASRSGSGSCEHRSTWRKWGGDRGVRGIAMSSARSSAPKTSPGRAHGDRSWVPRSETWEPIVTRSAAAARSGSPRPERVDQPVGGIRNSIWLASRPETRAAVARLKRT